MIKKVQIYKKDKWNMLNVEVHGTRFIVRVISDQWGEDNFEFLSRPALMHWAEERFSKERFEGPEEEREQILAAFKEV
ncbi:hypothetical protein [Paenibacillus flagellatus]|uniref:Uncharacterized protein n=1 Tax=Paenibacillus flagellatus TaxID=2211139 RepID=A0A2V5KMI8_9BACL|nr:hypothetical protein [Paenibacillus flagellatus]PYI56390.1 hypothetical protein DLM86_05275 [Paenibacillus flagellatus]